MNNKKVLLMFILVFMLLLVGCNGNNKWSNIDIDEEWRYKNVGSAEDELEYLYTKNDEAWDQELIDSILVYRNTEILPEAEGTYFEYKVGVKIIDIVITGKIKPYLEVLKSHDFRVPKNPSIAIPLIGIRSYYGCYSKNDTLKVYVYPIDEEHFEIEAIAKLPSGYDDTFKISKVTSRLDQLTYFYPYAETVSQYVIAPGGEVFSIAPSDNEYFVVNAYVELGDYKEYEEEIVTLGYVKDDEHKYHMGNLGCDILDINEENNSYKIKFYVREIPQFDYEHYVANYNNGNYTFPVLNGERNIVLVFDNGTIYCNPPRKFGEDVESKRSTLNYDRVGCSSPTMLHIYGKDIYLGGYYDFIVDYNFFNKTVSIVEDNSHLNE